MAFNYLLTLICRNYIYWCSRRGTCAIIKNGNIHSCFEMWNKTSN